jgi:hypothetical protein
MAEERISEYSDDGTSHPIQENDLLDFSNDTDGGTIYDVSKKILVSELLTFIQDNIGSIWGAGTPFTIPRFGDDNILADSPMTVEEVGLAILSKRLGIGVSPDGAIGLKISSENISMNDLILLTDGVTDLFKVDDSGFVFLNIGTSINEISIDGTLADDSDDAVPTEKAVKTYVDGLVAPQIIGGVTLSSSSNTNILNGTYVILADTTTVTSVTSGIGQDSNWTLEVTQAGITNQKGVVTFTGNLEKNAGGGVNYDIAIFKNGSIVSESEQIDQKLESGGKGQSVTVMAITEFSTNDTFDIRVAGNGTADDIFCGGGSLYIQ